MKLIAKRGASTYLLQDDEMGIIVDVEERIQFRPQPLRSILKQGYWEAKESTPKLVKFLTAMPKAGPAGDGKPSREAKPKSYAMVAESDPVSRVGGVLSASQAMLSRSIKSFLARDRARYAAKMKSKAGTKSPVVTGAKGDKGRYVTLDDGRVVFIETAASVAKNRKKRDDAKKPFVPKTILDHAMVEFVGNDKQVVESFKPWVMDAHAYLMEERFEARRSLQEVLSQFGHTGRAGSAFIANLRYKKDHSNIRGFDEMAEYAVKYHPELLSPSTGESEGDNDYESMLFRRLQEGFTPPPAKYSQEVLELAARMAGPTFFAGDKLTKEEQAEIDAYKDVEF